MSTNRTILDHITSLEWHIQNCHNRMLKIEGELKAYEYAVFQAKTLLTRDEKIIVTQRTRKKQKAIETVQSIEQAVEAKKKQDTIDGNHTF